jgi:hypothetical protein
MPIMCYIFIGSRIALHVAHRASNPLGTGDNLPVDKEGGT